MYGLAQILFGSGATRGQRAECLELRALRQPVDDRSTPLLVVQQPRPRTTLRLRPDEQHRLPRHLQVHTSMSVDCNSSDISLFKFLYKMSCVKLF